MTDVEQIEAVLGSDLPEPSAAFAAELDRRVREGFPKPPRRRPVWLRPALAGAAVLVVIAVVALSVTGRSRDTTASLPAKPAPQMRDLSAGRQASSNAVMPTGERKVERDVQLTIATPQDKLQQAADGVGTVAESHHGFVSSSHVTTGDTGAGGSFELRVPQRELESTIADLSKLGELRSRSESAQDLTAPYGRTQDRLGNALVERRTLKLRRPTAAIRAR